MQIQLLRINVKKAHYVPVNRCEGGHSFAKMESAFKKKCFLSSNSSRERKRAQSDLMRQCDHSLPSDPQASRPHLPSLLPFLPLWLLAFMLQKPRI